MRSSSSLLALLACLLGHASAQKLTDAPTRENFYRRGALSATVIGNYVYIDGGELSQVLDGNPPNKQNYASNSVNSTLSIDISKSWTTADVSFRTIDRPWYSKANQAIWTDQEAGSFYVWGGKWIRGRNMTENTLWKFTPDGNGGGTWSAEAPANPELFKGLHQSEYGAFANTNDTGFYIGGIASGWTEYRRASTQVVPGMVAFNMKTKTWHNGTTSFSPFDTLTAGSAHFVPNFGPNGLVMVFGGISNPVVGEPNWETAPPFNFQDLTFFDPQTKKKYSQTATGDIPPSPRIISCVSGFQNSEGGYEILLTGGANKRDKILYDDAYVLSLPGFVWTKVASSPAGKRQSAACVSVGKRQMLSIGGTGSAWSDQDPAPQGLQLFDMTELKWKDSYDANAAAYERAAAIKTWYTNGSLDKVQWSSDEVRQMFSLKSTDSQNPPPSASTSADPSTSTGAEAQPTSQSVSTGAIAGGVVGGVAGLAILAAVAWFFIRRRNRTHSPVAPGTEYDEPAPAYYASEPYKPQIPGQELPGTKVVPSELNSFRDHVELGGSAAYANPSINHMAPVEMDATPARLTR